MIFLFTIFFSLNVYSIVPPSTFDSSYISLENSLLERGANNYKEAKTILSSEIVKSILNDVDNRVSDDFIIPEYFKSSVFFWFNIYTQYSSKNVVIHDSTHLDLIYHVLDFDELYKSDIHRFAKAKLQSNLSQEYIGSLKKTLISLSKKKSLFKKYLNKEEISMIQAIKNGNLTIPKNKKKRLKFFKNLAKNIRTQLGQRDKIYNGLARSIPYRPFIINLLHEFKLPQELLAISFLESSFNPAAVSKVAASGVWQFMPYISNLFMPKITEYYDYRSNPVISSVAAFHLLKQNKMILKKWDLAVPAYNSGTKHLVKARRKFKKVKNLSLEYILERYDHAHLGFASKNFYSEFLALAHVLAYSEKIYPTKGLTNTSLTINNPGNLNIFVSKCTNSPENVFNAQTQNKDYIHKLNSHLFKPNIKLKSGVLYVSDYEMDSQKFFKIDISYFKKHPPKKYPLLVKKMKCKL